MPRQNTEDSEIPQRRIAPNGYKLPTQLPEGIVVTDICAKQWRIGKPIGLGGFGEIYLASDNVGSSVGQDSEYVAKVEAHSSGPLFVEMNFYLRAARREMVDEWVARKDLRYLGMPFYLGSGSFWHKEEHFRFLVIPRYGQDLEKMFLERGRRFHLKTVLSVGLQVMDILEYVHAQGYVHADIKGSNLLVGEAHGEDDRVFLVDFGLATRYQIEGVHKEFKPDLRKAHDGTLEYTSRDAHQGAHSRRGDLEVLGYNLVQWLCSYLPWEGENANLDPEYIHAQKEGFMKDPAVLVRTCFSNSQPPMVLEKYLKYVTTLGFETKPDYEYCRKLFRQGLREAGYKDDGRLQLDSEPIASPPRSRKKAMKKKSSDEPENIAKLKPKKVVRVSPAQPCRPKNLNTRATRSSPTSPMLQSREPFDWERVLSSNPEKKFYKQRNPDPSTSPASAAQHHALTTRNTKSLPDQRKVRGLENPTPAMLQIMEARKQKSRPTSGQTTPNKRGRSESISLPAEDIPTAAMEEVMQQRQRRSSTSSSVVEQESRRGRGRARKHSATQVRLTRARTILKAAIASVRPRQSTRPTTLDLSARLKPTWNDDETSPSSSCHDVDKIVKHKQEVSLELPSSSLAIVNARKRRNSMSAKKVECIVSEGFRGKKRARREEACSEETPESGPRRRRYSKKEIASEDCVSKTCQGKEDKSQAKAKKFKSPGRPRKIQPPVEEVIPSSSQHTVQEELGTDCVTVKQRLGRRAARKIAEVEHEEVFASTSQEAWKTTFVEVKPKVGRPAARKVLAIQAEEIIPSTSQCIEDLETPCEIVKLRKGRRGAKKNSDMHPEKIMLSSSQCIEDLETPCEIVKLRKGRRGARKVENNIEEAVPSTSQRLEAETTCEKVKSRAGRHAARKVSEYLPEEAEQSTSLCTIQEELGSTVEEKESRTARRLKKKRMEKEQKSKCNRPGRKAKIGAENKKIEDEVKDDILGVEDQNLDSRWGEVREFGTKSKNKKKEEIESDVEEQSVKTSRRGRRKEIGSDAEEKKLRIMRNVKKEEAENETEFSARASRKVKKEELEVDDEERKPRAVRREGVESETEEQLPVRACRRARKEEVDTDSEDLELRLRDESESDPEERQLRHARRKLEDCSTPYRTRYTRKPLRTDVQYRLKVLMSLEECSTYSPSVDSECSGSLYEPSVVDSEDLSSIHSLKVRLYRGGKTPEWKVDRARRGLDMTVNVQRRVTRNCGKL